jgi:NAD(P)-dependent dehydrogenase (short-subunit alcohol dehydrogenase family)
MVRHCLREGSVVFAAARHPDAPELVSLQDAYSSRLIRIPMDVSRTDSVTVAAEQVARHTDRLDLVINNAGAHPVDSKAPLAHMDPDNCLDIFNLNTVGPLRVVKAFLPLLERGSHPTVVISPRKRAVSAPPGGTWNMPTACQKPP